MIDKKWLEQGFIDEPIPEGIDVKAEIRRMCKEKNALIMAHYYTEGVIQELADFVGDSLALAQKAATTDADIIVMCGVHFMGETNKILCPEKTIRTFLCFGAFFRLSRSLRRLSTLLSFLCLSRLFFGT